GQQSGDALGPFDDDDSVLVEELGEADGFEIVGAVDAVGVEVEEGEAAGVVDVQEDEGGAGDGAGVAAEADEQAADELGFAGAEVAVEGDALAAGEIGGKFGGDGFGALDAVGLVDHSVCSQPLGSMGVRASPWTSWMPSLSGSIIPIMVARCGSM